MASAGEIAAAAARGRLGRVYRYGDLSEAVYGHRRAGPAVGQVARHTAAFPGAAHFVPDNWVLGDGFVGVLGSGRDNWIARLRSEGIIVADDGTVPVEYRGSWRDLVQEPEPVETSSTDGDTTSHPTVPAGADLNVLQPPPPVGAAGTIEAVGVDGCPAGWIAAVSAVGEGGKRTTRLSLFADLEELVEAVLPVGAEAIIGIDVPIGLPARVGPRACDLEAQKRLRHADPALARHRSVFQVPDRDVLACSDFPEVQALTAQRRVNGERVRGLSRQSFGIVRKIAEADALLRQHPEWRDVLVEVHPEVSALLLCGAPLPSKKRAEGRALREAALRQAFLDYDAAVSASPFPRKQVGRDDVIDAFIGLWSALRFRGQVHTALGDGASDAEGLPMRMVV